MCVIRISTYNAIIMKVKWNTEYKLLRKTPGIKKLISVIIRIFLIMNYCILSRDHTLRHPVPSLREVLRNCSKSPCRTPTTSSPNMISLILLFFLGRKFLSYPKIGQTLHLPQKIPIYIYTKVTVENIQPLILRVPRTSVYTWQIFWNFLWL